MAAAASSRSSAGRSATFPRTTRAEFLAAIAAGLEPGDTFLLGTDLVKDPARLVAAYDDASGVTAAFNRNVLLVLNRELGADFDPDAFTHVARWNADEEWIEMWLRVAGGPVGQGPGARPRRRARSRRGDAHRDLGQVPPTRASPASSPPPASTLTHWWTDPAGDFALSLSTPTR